MTERTVTARIITTDAGHAAVVFPAESDGTVLIPVFKSFLVSPEPANVSQDILDWWYKQAVRSFTVDLGESFANHGTV